MDNIIEYNKTNTEIWLTDWIFYYKQTAKEKYDAKPIEEHIVPDMLCKRIPRFEYRRHNWRQGSWNINWLGDRLGRKE